MMPESESISPSAPEALLSAIPSELVGNTAVVSVEGTVDEPLTTATVNEEQYEGAKVNPKRLYISNVSYQTTEDDLKDLLKEYEM